MCEERKKIKNEKKAGGVKHYIVHYDVPTKHSCDAQKKQQNTSKTL